MASATLESAFTTGDLRPLPGEAVDLLRELGAPPRLAAHLRAVHDVAGRLTEWLAREYPAIGFDRQAVLFGAATHDIGKARHREELSGPGSAHERDGYRLLLDRDVPERLARFARTHASWAADDIRLEDLLVSLADKVWKGKRVADLEQLVIDRLAGGAGQEPWEAFMALDEELGRLADGADERLAFQASFPVTG